MKITLRFTLSSVITVLTVFTSLSIFLISYVGSTGSLLMLTDNLTLEVAKGIIGRTKTLFDSAERANTQLAYLIRSGVLGRDDPETVMGVAREWIAVNEGFTSVDIGFPSGDKFKAERMPDDSISMRSYVRDATGVRMTWRHANPAYNGDPKYQDTFRDLAKGYDPRTRPWWTTAVANGRTGWTDMYVSGLRKQFVYSCATPVYGKDEALLAVTSIDINVVALSEFLGTLNILQHGRAFVLNEKKQVIAVPIKSDADLDQLVKINHADKENPYELYPLDELPDEDIRGSVQTYILKHADGKEEDNFEFTGKENEKYLCRIVDFKYKGNTNFIIGIIIPKQDVMAAINEKSRYIMAGIILFTLAALLIGMAISKTMSRSLTVLAGEVDRVGRLDLASGVEIKSQLLEVHNISESVTSMRNGLRSFKKYVPADLVVHLNEQRKEAVLEGERRELTVFFSDIADFTSISERLPAETLVGNLGVYFDGLSTIIHENMGTLDKYIGDCVMAFWGAPIPRSTHAALACASALACQEFLDGLRKRWSETGQPIFDTRIGVHTGEVIVGNIGSPQRMNYTIVGDNVNLASRLEGLNKHYGTRIIISEACFGQVQGQFAVRRLDMVAVKGRETGILVYELLGAAGGVDASRLALAECYGHGLDLYLKREWARAGKLFQEAAQLAGGRDAASELLAARCAEYQAAPPDADWNGVYRMRSK